MKKYFRCGECGADFNYPIIRFDNGLKVCPACLSFVTDDAWVFFLKRKNWLKRQKLKKDDMKRLFNNFFPVNTKTIFGDDKKEV